MNFPWRRKQHDFDLPSESWIEEIIEAARHASVTREALTETRRSRYLRSDTGWLYRRPLISYLDSDEQPHFILESTQPVKVEREEETEEMAPTSPHRSFACITDRRVLLLVGREPENWAVALKFEDLDDFGLKPGNQDPQKAENVDISTTFTPILRLRKESVRYSFIDETSLTLQDIRSLGALIMSHFSEDRWEYEAFWETAERVRKDKQREAAERRCRQLERRLERQREQEEREREEQLRREAAERERREQLGALAKKSTSTSVSPERLEEIVDVLDTDETVDFMLWRGSAFIAILSLSGEIELLESYEQDWVAITPRQVLFSLEGYTRGLPYRSIDSARIDSCVPENSEKSRSPALLLRSCEFIYLFQVSDYAYPHLQDLVEAVRERLKDS